MTNLPPLSLCIRVCVFVLGDERKHHIFNFSNAIFLHVHADDICTELRNSAATTNVNKHFVAAVYPPDNAIRRIIQAGSF